MNQTNNKSPKIDFNQPYIAGNQIMYMQQALNSRHISGDGPFTNLCHQFLEERLGVKKALLTTNCTHALEMASILLDLNQDDEVIVPSFTFVSTVNAFILRGAKPIFIDIRPDTLNLDEAMIENAITRKTKAIFVVHYAGVGCEMDIINPLASHHGIKVVEDNAHGLFGAYRGQNLGTFGNLATQSFHETKNISCGEGGALIINDESMIERAEIIREKGTNRSRFFRGQIDKYTWVDIGSSYLPSDILAAILFSQLEEADKIQQKRKEVWNLYHAGLNQWAKTIGAALPFVPDYCEQSYHMFYLIMPDLKSRQALIQFLKEHGIQAVFHYVPLHTSDMGIRMGYHIGQLPVTESISDRLVRLPFHNNISTSEQQYVIDTITRFQG
jgi:dTDP-4-amino-4,6-dideoxygalactose transaminase